MVTKCIEDINLALFILFYFDLNIEVLSLQISYLSPLLKHVNLQIHFAFAQAVDLLHLITSLFG